MQFAYRANRSAKHTVNMTVHYVFEHLDIVGTYVRMLVLDFSSAFNIVGLSVLESLIGSGRGHRISGQQVSTVEAGEEHLQFHWYWLPIGCVLSLSFVLPLHQPLRFSSRLGLAPEVCRQHHPGERTATWSLNPLRAVEMSVNLWKNAASPLPMMLRDSLVECVVSSRILFLTIPRNLE